MTKEESQNKHESGTEFVSLIELLRSGLTVGDLATAIETTGAVGWDRFGRFKRFAKDSKEMVAALDALASVFAFENFAYHPDEQHPAESPVGNPLHEFGWLRGELPVFDVAAAAPVGKHLRPQQKRQENADLVLIAGLLLFIKGQLKCRPHPDFTTQAELVAALQARMGDYPGLSDSTISRKFAGANKIIGSDSPQ